MPGATKSSPPALPSAYALERELGHGGMATVYLAEDRKHGRKVAIKIIHPDLAASVSAERFLREIGIAARLAHPHILPLLDSGAADGLLYYVSPFVPGGSLRDRLNAEQRLLIADSIRIAAEIAAGLDYAHREGIVHRDVKPENILFADGHALLADFGVARAHSASNAEPVTGAGMALGTPEYMSPEQASGDATLDARSDVYSLGCVVYEMLAGEPPLRGEGPRATMARQVTGTPRLLRTLRPEVSLALEGAVGRALAKDPAHRWPSAAEFASALRGAVPEQGASASPSRAIAVLPFVNASPDPENEYLSDGITEELIDALSKIAGLSVASRTSVFALKGKAQDVRVLGALLGVSVVLEGSVRKIDRQLRVTAQLTSADDGRLIWSQRYDRTLEDVFALQDELAATIVSTLRATSFADLPAPVPRRYTKSVTAFGLYLRGRHAWNRRTDSSTAEAIAYFEQAIAADPRYALAYTGLSDAYALHVDYRSVPVHEGFARARTYAQKALEIDDAVAEAHTSLAWALFIYDWDWIGAEREFRRAIALDPTYATAHQWFSMLLAARGQVHEGIIAAHTAQDFDSASVSIRRSLAYSYFYARRYAQARYHSQRAVAMSPGAEESHRVHGLVLAADGQFDEAERVLRDALALPDASNYTFATLGFTLGRAGRTDEAHAIASELERRAERGYVSPVALATVFLGLGLNDAALEYAERAVAERRGWVVYFGVNPLVDPLRGHPRFEAIVDGLALS